MKRAGLLVIVVLSLLLGMPAERAEAFHGHHWGHRHWGGWGYGGWGYRGFYGGGFGYRPFNFYRPYVGIGIGVGYPAYFYSGPYYYSAPYFLNQQPYFYNSYYYGFPSCNYSVPTINYYAAPAINVTRVVVRKAAPAPAVDPAVPAAAPRDLVVRSTTITDRSKARQQIKLGDAAFLAGRYSDALNRYRSAAEAAPDYAEAHYRKGHAYVGSGKYELAAASFRRGLQLEPAAGREGFRLDDLYGAGSAAKGVHLENLAAAALMREEIADHYFLLGLMLRFDGAHDRAEKFLAKVATLSPAMRTAVAAFLPDAVERPVSLEVGDEI